MFNRKELFIKMQQNKNWKGEIKWENNRLKCTVKYPVREANLTNYFLGKNISKTV